MRKTEVNLIRDQIVKRLMGTLSIIEHEPLSKTLPQLGTVVERPNEMILILQRPPKTFNENIVMDTVTTVQPDPHIVRFE